MPPWIRKVRSKRWNLEPDEFDLGDEAESIAQHADRAGIAFVNLAGAYREAGDRKDRYLPFDGHPNEAGHEIAARTVAATLRGHVRRR